MPRKNKKDLAKDKARKEYKEEKTRNPEPELSSEEKEVQSHKQRLMQFASSEHASLVVDIIRACAQKVPLVGNSEFETLKNAIIMDTTSTLMRDVVEYLEDIKKGLLHGRK